MNHQELLECFGRSSIGHSILAEDLDFDMVHGVTPQGLLATEGDDYVGLPDNYLQLSKADQAKAAAACRSDWGAFDRLPPEQQRKWIRKAKARNDRSRTFWINYFRPISIQRDKSADVLHAILQKTLPASVMPEPQLEDQVYGNALISQIARLPHYDHDRCRDLLSVFAGPMWYEGENFRLESCTQILFAHASPPPLLVKMWTRILAGYPEFQKRWGNTAIRALILAIGEPLSLHHGEEHGRQQWDVYVTLLASPHVRSEIKNAILDQVRHSFLGFRIVLHKLFSVAKELKAVPRSSEDEEDEFNLVDPAVMCLIEAEERWMKMSDAEESWLRGTVHHVDSKDRIDRHKAVLAEHGHLVSSRDMFCAWCLKKCEVHNFCSRCKGPGYCSAGCQLEAWKSHHKNICSTDIGSISNSSKQPKQREKA